MNHVNSQKTHDHQNRYFGGLFSKINSYRLKSWQKSYILRIKRDLIGKDYREKTIIDIGTGEGYVAIETAKLGLKVIATDLTKEALENLSEYKKKFKLDKIKLIHGKAEKIPLNDESVDFIVANAVLEHILKEDQAIKEWKRILKPGGRMMITVPLKYRFIWPFFWPINYINDKMVGHLRRYDANDLQRKIGYKIKRTYYTGHFLKVSGTLLSILLRKDLGNLLETIDKKKEKNRYGASNIVAIFEKSN